jgi:hypothetical protein
MRSIALVYIRKAVEEGISHEECGKYHANIINGVNLRSRDFKLYSFLIFRALQSRKCRVTYSYCTEYGGINRLFGL